MLTAKATALALAHPEQLLRGNAMPTEALLAMAKAARLKIFLEVLADICKPDYLPCKAKLSLTPGS